MAEAVSREIAEEYEEKRTNKFKGVAMGFMSVQHALDEVAAEQSDPLGSLQQFLNKEKFENHYNRVKEMLSTEERSGGVYSGTGGKDGKSKKKKKERKWVFVIISQDQIIQENVSSGDYAALKRKTLVNAAAIKQEQLRVQKEILKGQREKLVKGILEELEELTYNRKSTNYKGKISQLPQIDSKESRLYEVMKCYQRDDGLTHLIKTASDKILRTSLGTVSHFAPIVEDVVEAFYAHQKVVAEQTSPKPVLKPKNESKALASQHEESFSSISRRSSNIDSIKLPLIRRASSKVFSGIELKLRKESSMGISEEAYKADLKVTIANWKKCYLPIKRCLENYEARKGSVNMDKLGFLNNGFTMAKKNIYTSHVLLREDERVSVELTKEVLMLGHMGLQEIDLVHLCLNFPFLPSLRIVNIENNPIGDGAGCLFVTLLAQYADSLETLILKGTQIRMNTIAALYLLLEGEEFSAKDRKIRELSIANNLFQQEEVCKFLLAVSKSATLQVLDLSGLGLSEGCIKSVATVISYDKKLSELDLSNNKMDNESQRILFSTLARNRKLKKLSLCNIGLNNTSLKTLKLGVVYNRGLRELHLDKNQITEAGLNDIKEVIVGNKGIELVSIGENPIKSLKLLRDSKKEIEKVIKCGLWIETKQAYNEHLKSGI